MPPWEGLPEEEAMTDSARQKAICSRIELIVVAVNNAKARTIKRINKQLARMSLNDVVALERLIGKRR